MDNSTSHVVVTFHGDGAGTEELTWGQRDVWDLMRRTGRTMNIGGTVPAAEGETVERVATVLSLLVGRHQALRTRLSPRHVPDLVHQVSVLPRTLSGKRIEVPAKKILRGVPTDEAVARGALTSPTALSELEEFRDQLG